MINYKWLIFVSIIMILISCSASEVDNPNKIIIDNNSIKVESDVSNIFSDVSITQLNEVSGSYIGDAHKIFVWGNNLIIFDKFHTKKICLYDIEGNFIKTILKIGDTPSDALQINDCWLTDKGVLEAYDFSTKKIYQFDDKFDLNKIINSPNKEYIFKNLVRIPNSSNYIGYAAFNEYNPKFNKKHFHIGILDSEMNLIDATNFYDDKFQGIDWLIPKNPLVVYKDTVKFLTAFDNNIYEFNGKDMKKSLKIHFTKNPVPDDVFGSIVEDNLALFKNRNIDPNEQMKLLSGFTRLEGTWLENENFLYFLSFDEKYMPFATFFSKKKQFKTITAKMFTIPKYKMVMPYFQYFDAQTGTFYSILDGRSLMQYLSKGSPFLNTVNDDPQILYIIRTKFI